MSTPYFTRGARQRAESQKHIKQLIARNSSEYAGDLERERFLRTLNPRTLSAAEEELAWKILNRRWAWTDPRRDVIDKMRRQYRKSVASGQSSVATDFHKID